MEIPNDQGLILVIRSAEGEGEEGHDEVWRQPIERLPMTVVPELPADGRPAAGSQLRASIEGDHHWALPIELSAEPGASAELVIWPAAWIEARVVVPKQGSEDDQAPRKTSQPLEVRFQKGADGPGLDEFQAVGCPVEQDRLRCKLPAGRLDLRFALPELVPIYRWDRALERDRPNDLGPLAFRRGASMVGWVAAEDGPLTEAELAEVEVALAPGVIAQSAEKKALERRAAMTRRITPGPRGFFQVSGIDPGLYQLEADHPAYAAARQGPVLVKTGAELELELLELPPATSLEVRTSLPLDPYSKLWTVELHRQGPDQVYMEKVAEGEADENGVWHLGDLDPGRYSLHVKTSRGAFWHNSTIDVWPGPNSVEAAVPFTRLEGLVTLDGEPVPHYTVHFYAEDGGLQVQYPGQETGRFYAFLPRDKAWRVSIDQPSMDIFARFNDLEVPPRKKEERWPKIEIEIPDTRLEGQVVDADHQPVEGITVDIIGQKSSAFRKSDEEGRFVFRGIQPNDRLQVQALGIDPPRESQVEQVELLESGELELAPLVLESSHVIVGHLVGAQGEPVAAARVVAKPRFQPGQSSPSTSDTIEFTDLEGVFELTVPGRVDEYWLTFAPPGYALSHQLVRLPLEEPLIVLAEEQAGTLVVRYEEPPELFRDAKLGSFGGQFIYLKFITQIVGEGPVGDFFGLEDWGRRHRTRELDARFERIYPQLAPGPYSACLQGEITPALVLGRPLPPELEARHCASGYLSANSELVLTIPQSAYEAAAARLRAEQADGDGGEKGRDLGSR